MGKIEKYNYGVVLDAGSSGTRVYVYRWLKNSLARQKPDLVSKLPELETKDKWTKKVHPGISTLGQTPGLVGDHLKPLLEHAARYVPKDVVPNTPVFLLATAGMRLLPEKQQKDVLKSVCSYVKTQTRFFIPDCDLHIQIIPGSTEGLYGWIAANYLLGGFDDPTSHNHGKNHHTYGFLDLGGASAQIAFAPNSTEAAKHAEDLTLMRLRTVNGVEQEHRVFVTTFLGFGVNEARKKFVKSILDTYLGVDQIEIPDPCLPKGVRLTPSGALINSGSAEMHAQHLFGTGQFNECLKRTFPILEKDKECTDEPCLINGQHVPGIDFDVNHFVGVSEYWHTTHEIFEMGHDDKAYDFGTYQQRVSEFCSSNWRQIQTEIKDSKYGKKVDERSAYEVCFKASWLINILHDGFGIPRVGLEKGSLALNGTASLPKGKTSEGYLDPFQAVEKIRDTEVSWTMGKMVLYASADVPPISDSDLPVGFGTNTAGIPDDFQMPGGGLLQPYTGIVPSSSIAGKISDALFDSSSSHRIPGYLLFVLVVVMAFFFSIRRMSTRRSKSKTVATGTIAARIAKIVGLRKKLRGRDKELEEGNQPLYNANEFELGAMDSSDEDTTTGSKINSGYASPNVRRSKSSTTLAGRLTPDLMDRKGMLVRNDSRERFKLGGRVGRNDSKSPTRTSRNI